MFKGTKRLLVLAIFSGILLTLSFPNFNLGFLAWIALIPLLYAIHHSTSRAQAAFSGWIAGLVFYGFSLHWLVNVSTFGWLFVTSFETSFLVLFALAVYEGMRMRSIFPSSPHGVRRGSLLADSRLPRKGAASLKACGNDDTQHFFASLWIACSWTVFEFFRSEIPVFASGWNLLAYSQSDYLGVIQSANTVGAYGLGFVIVFFNVCLFQIRFKTNRGQTPVSFVRGLTPIGVGAIILGLVAGHGVYHLKKNPGPSGKVNISVIQGNIPQDIKWQEVARGRIIELYSELTQLASFDNPDLILWPEAAFPGYFNRDLESQRIHDLVKRIQIPLVVGSPHFETAEIAFNSAYLLNGDGEIKSRYDKRHLVPFGEYVPLKPLFGFLEPIATSLGVSDFSEGREATVFDTGNGELLFSTLICFEDIFPGLAKSFVDAGARLLAVITNDAWFGETAAPYQHLQASIFRAVENGVPVVRAANTGVSAFISAKGEVLGRVSDELGRSIFVTGKKTLEVPINPNLKPTLYRRAGWIFPYFACAGFVIMLLVIKTIDRRPKTKDLN